jgi:hypothetical protein
MYEYSGSDVNCRPKKISILLYNQSTFSNGFVVWAPKRAEWITTPPIDTYAQDWLEQLALHEYRHVVQIDKLEQGFTKVMKIIFGEMAVGAMAGFLPFWFLEGDATVSETAYSSTGRGRQPDFSMELRAIELEKEKRYSYDQSYLGSYNYFIPDHYKYGYHMVGYGKLKYKSKLWSNTLNNVARKPFTLAPFYFGLKKNGASSKVKLYHQTFDSLKIHWSKTITVADNKNTFNYYTPDAKYFTNYLFPQQTKDGLFAVKTSIEDITRFVLINDSIETIIHTPGRYYNTPVFISNKYIVWEETIPDKRWQKRTYSVIKLFHKETGKERILSRKTRYYYPVLSPNNTEIACIEINLKNKFSIVILSVMDSKVVKKIPFGDGVNIQGLAWLDNNQLIYISMNENGKNLNKIDLRSGKSVLLFNSGLVNITHPAGAGDHVLFTCDNEIARNIYAYSIIDGSIYRVTNTKYGSGFPSYDFTTSNILYSEYTASGYRPVGTNLQLADKTPLAEIETYEYPWAESLSEKAAVNIQKTNYEKVRYDSSRYRRSPHSVNIHSWAPFYFDIDDFTSFEPNIYPGFIILSQNKLSTVTSTISYYYTNTTHHFKPKVTFEGLFPVFEIGALVASNPAAVSSDPNVPGPTDVKNYSQIYLRSYLPLNFSRNKYSKIFKPGFEYSHWNTYYVKDSTYQLGFDYLEFSLSGSHLLKKSHRDLYPRFGQTLYLSFNQSLRDPASFGNKTLAILNLYFPGITGHHSTRLYLAHEKNDNKIYILRPQASLPRGYYTGLIRYIDIISGKFEYTFPFLYPDWSIGPIAYIRRFQASLFCDAASIKYSQEDDHLLVDKEFLFSVGTTLGAEMNFLRFFVPFTPKITVSYLPDKSLFDFSFGISIDSSVF